MSVERMAARDSDPGLRHALGAPAPRVRGAGRQLAYLDALLARPDPTQEAEEELAARAAGGDAPAREKLVEVFLPRVVVLARRLAGRGTEFADLVQEGVLCLLEALARFDAARGTPFWAYAAPWVRGGMLRLVQDESRAVRLPPRARADLAALKDAEAALRQEGWTSGNLAEVAERAGVDLARAEALARADRPVRSLDEPLAEDDDSSVGDVLGDPAATAAYDEVVARASQPELAALLGALSSRERDVLERRFGLGGRPEESLASVGERLGVSRERVRQIESRALDKLRRAA